MHLEHPGYLKARKKQNDENAIKIAKNLYYCIADK